MMTRALLLMFAVITLVGRAPAQPRPSVAAAPRLHVIDPENAQGLRELLRYTDEVVPVVSAHRGGAGPGLPENCLATFEETLRHSFAMLEIDPRYTRDGEIVVHHDATLDRTTTGRGPVAERSLVELKQLRLKDTEGNVTSFQIPTLDEVLEWARGKTVLVLDSKDVSVAARVKKIEEHGAEGYAMLIVGSPRLAQECYRLNPDVMMEVMMPDGERFHALEKTGIPWSNVIAFVGHQPTEDQELLQMLHSKGVTCIAGTSRNLDRELVLQSAGGDPQLEQRYQALLARGIDLIETDLPREVWPLLYDGSEVPESKSQFLRWP